MKPFRTAPFLLIATLLLTGLCGPLTFSVARATDFYDEPGTRLLNQPVSE